MRRLGFVAAGGMILTPLLALPAAAATCTAGEMAPPNFNCSVANITSGPLTFSGIQVAASTTGSGSVTFTSLTATSTVVAGVTEFGLLLDYVSNTGLTAGSTADISLAYTVAGASIVDAFMSFTGVVSGPGSTDTLSETLSNGVTLQLLAPGSTSAIFAAVSSLSALKDQDDFLGTTAGISQSSALVNAFSVAAVPIPGALPLFATGLFGLWGLRRKRKSTAAA